MKEWARSFYQSTAWEDTRAAFLLSKDNICERCGEPAKIVHHKTYITKENINDINITLCWDNLEALCQDCHNKEHHKKNNARYTFDAKGNILPPCQGWEVKGTDTEGDTLKLPSGRAYAWCRGCGGEGEKINGRKERKDKRRTDKNRKEPTKKDI